MTMMMVMMAMMVMRVMMVLMMKMIIFGDHRSYPLLSGFGLLRYHRCPAVMAHALQLALLPAPPTCPGSGGCPRDLVPLSSWYWYAAA